MDSACPGKLGDVCRLQFAVSRQQQRLRTLSKRMQQRGRVFSVQVTHRPRDVCKRSAPHVLSRGQRLRLQPLHRPVGHVQ